MQLKKNNSQPTCRGTCCRNLQRKVPKFSVNVIYRTQYLLRNLKKQYVGSSLLDVDLKGLIVAILNARKRRVP